MYDHGNPNHDSFLEHIYSLFSTMMWIKISWISLNFLIFIQQTEMGAVMRYISLRGKVLISMSYMRKNKSRFANFLFLSFHQCIMVNNLSSSTLSSCHLQKENCKKTCHDIQIVNHRCHKSHS